MNCITKLSDEEFYEKYYKIVYEVCKEYRRQPYYEDMVQECFIKMFDIKNKYNQELGKFSTYLYKSLKNSTIQTRANWENIIRVPAYRKGEGALEVLPPKITKKGTEINFYNAPVIMDKDFNWKYNLKQAKKYINDERIYKVLVMRVQGYGLREIGENLNLTPKGVHVILNKISSQILDKKWVDIL